MFAVFIVIGTQLLLVVLPFTFSKHLTLGFSNVNLFKEYIFVVFRNLTLEKNDINS